MPIEFHDPRANPSVPARPYALQASMQSAIDIGLLANGFPDSEAFLNEVDHALAAALPNATVKRYNKHGASAPASTELMDTIAEECDVFLSAYGH
ncbi:MAG: hypothetical protein AAF387_04920 [Pseudomonadota bacterium]